MSPSVVASTHRVARGRELDDEDKVLAERSGTMRREETEERRTENPPRSLFFAGESNWWLFCLAIVVLKLLLLALDPSPKLYVGDSLSYIWTALSGWIPEDRSYFYGYVIRWVSVWTQSLTSLLIVQVFLGAIVAITVAWICRIAFGLSERLGYLFGFLCAIDPLQLTWERYVMTETFSLFFYALTLQQSFVYLRDRRITTLMVIQVLSVITIGFRIVFLFVVQVMAVALPLIAFLSQNKAVGTATAARPGRLEFLKRRAFWQHLAVSVIAMFLLDQGYKRAYGFLSHREPAHLHGSGYFLLAAWAPALQPEDATDPRLAEIIEHGSEFALGDFSFRGNQRFAPGYLIDRWRRVEPNRRKSGKIAMQTALNALKRDPAAVIGLAAQSYLVFWRGDLKRFLQWDLGVGILKNSELKFLAERFHWTGRADVASEPQTFTKRYYVAAFPYYFVLLLSPLLSLALLFFARDKPKAWFLFIHTATMFAVTLLLSVGAYMRYFQPVSLLTLLSIALTVKSYCGSIRAKDAAGSLEAG
jgi:hypothetical protein